MLLDSSGAIYVDPFAWSDLRTQLGIWSENTPCSGESRYGVNVYDGMEVGRYYVGGHYFGRRTCVLWLFETQ